MPNDPDGLSVKDAYVTVCLDLGDDPPFHFETTDLRLDPPDHLYFKFGKKDGFRVHFTLDDPTYVFADKKSEALYAHQDARCPEGPCKWSGFHPLRVEDDGQTLVVHNKNDGVADFGYMLRITNDAGKSHLELDPIGSNQNSNSSNQMAAIAIFAVGAAVGAIAAASAMSLATAD